MSTVASTVRPSTSANLRPPAPPPGGGALALATLDPLRLLKRYYPWLVVAAIVGAVAGTAAHFALAKAYPTYTSTATFECRPPTFDIKQSGQGATPQDDFQRFMMTQAAIMTSTSVLEPSVKDPDIERSKWAGAFVRSGTFQPRDAMEQLARDLVARPVQQTSLIRLSLSARDPESARTVVDAVSRTYIEQYQRSNFADTGGRRDALTKQIRELDQQIREKNGAREKQLVDQKVTDLRDGQGVEDQRAAQINEQLTNARRDYATTSSLLDRYTALQVQNVTIPIPDDIAEEAKRDPVVGTLDGQIAQYRTDDRALGNQGFLPEHPSVVAIRKRIEAAVQEREDVFNTAARKLFDAQIDRLRTQKSAMESQIAQLETDMETVSKRKEDLTRLRVILQQIDEDVQRLNAERADLVQARNNLETLSANEVFARVRLIQPAQLPREMAFPQLKILVPLGVFLMVSLVGGVLVLREVLDQRVKGPQDVAIIPRMRVLGMVPDASEDPVKAANLETAFRDAPTGVVSESFRQLRAPLMKSMDQAGYRTLLILAGMPGSGATTVASNIALACAGAGERVLIIDANMRRPGVHRVYGLTEAPGLGDVLAGQSMLSDCIRPTTAQNLSVLTAGSQSNRLLPERLSSEAMGRLLSEAATKFDRVIIDAPPAIVAGDGLAVANRVDAVALVVRALAEKRGLVNRLRTQLSETRAEFLGVVVNAVRSSAGGYFKGNIKATHEYQAQSK